MIINDASSPQQQNLECFTQGQTDSPSEQLLLKDPPRTAKPQEFQEQKPRPSTAESRDSPSPSSSPHLDSSPKISTKPGPEHFDDAVGEDNRVNGLEGNVFALPESSRVETPSDTVMTTDIVDEGGVEVPKARIRSVCALKKSIQ